MGYQISLPIDLEIGNLAIVPEAAWIIPADVLNGKTDLVKDPSNTDPYLSAGLTLSLTLY